MKIFEKLLFSVVAGAVCYYVFGVKGMALSSGLLAFLLSFILPPIRK
jgi:hypothetical protein